MAEVERLSFADKRKYHLPNIRSLLPLAFKFISILVAIWLCLIFAVWALPLVQLQSLQVLFIKIGAVAPVFLPRFLVKPYIKLHQHRVSWSERLTLLVLCVPFVGLAAAFVQTTIVFLLAGPDLLGMTYVEALLAPLGSRLSLGVAWGMSFAQISLLVTAIALLVFFPLRISVAARKNAVSK